MIQQGNTAAASAALDLATRAELAAAALALDGFALGGAVVRAPRSDLAEAFAARVRALLPANAPHRRLPLAIPDDRLLGGLDLAMTLAHGRPVADRGLLAALDGGLLIVPGAERIGATLAARLAQMLDLGIVAQRVRADDAPDHHAARVMLIAIDESEADEEPVHGAIADRCAFHLALDTSPLPQLYSREDIAAAAELLPHVDTDAGRFAANADAHSEGSAQSRPRALVHTAEVYGISSLRAVRAALRAARCFAALDGRRVTSDADIATAAALVLGPRATRLPAPPPESSNEQEPPPPDESQSTDDKAERDDQDVRELEDRIIDAMAAALPVGLTMDGPHRAPKSGRAAGRAGADRSGGLRGRQVGTRRGDPRHGGRLDLVETLRTAAPWQPLRRTQVSDDARMAPAAPRAGGATSRHPRVLVRPDDFRIRRLYEPAGTTAIFVVDASGSSAVNRMAEAKGAVELLLAESYQRRDEVALIAFRGTQADILLPPTRAIAAAKRALAALPGGGGTPLASAIDRAVELTVRARRDGNDTVVVFLTDARANVARDGGGGRERAMQDALQSSRVLRGLEGQVLFIDTSPRTSQQAQDVAMAMGARYIALPRTDARSIHAAVTAARA